MMTPFSTQHSTDDMLDRFCQEDFIDIIAKTVRRCRFSGPSQSSVRSCRFSGSAEPSFNWSPKLQVLEK
jgi:hypothetical protein